MKANNIQSKYIKYIPIICLLVMLFTPDAYAAAGGQTADIKVFSDISKKILGWIDGGLGKTLVVISFVIAVVMGLAGFKAMQIAIPIGIGILLMSIGGLAGLFFA